MCGIFLILCIYIIIWEQIEKGHRPKLKLNFIHYEKCSNQFVVDNRNDERKNDLIWIIFCGIFVREAYARESWNENGANDRAHKSISIHKSWKGYLFIFIKYAYLLSLLCVRPNNVNTRTNLETVAHLHFMCNTINLRAKIYFNVS